MDISFDINLTTGPLLLVRYAEADWKGGNDGLGTGVSIGWCGHWKGRKMGGGDGGGGGGWELRSDGIDLGLGSIYR